MLKDKTVILGVTGSIAAYKGVDLASRLTQDGALVLTVMTESATKFVAPLAFESITGQAVYADLWQQAGINHITLAEQADIVLIAPATANTIARIACGLADDVLSCMVLATRAPVIVAPAMHTNMYENPATCHNCHLLRERGFILVGPGEGRLASGDYGKGRLADIDTIVGTVKHVVACGGDLVGKKIVITCGGTREPLDPVRFIGNRSSGKTGYALAVAARDRGAAVTLITTVEVPGETVGIELVRVETAAQMLAAVNGNVEDIGCLIMAAAVADYRPALFSSDKIKKGSGELTLKLSPTADILSQIGGNFLRIGFAAETGNLEANAREKLGSKKLDLIIANDVNQPEGGFGSDYNQVKLIFKGGMIKDLPLMAKKTMAHEILDEIITLGI